MTSAMLTAIRPEDVCAVCYGTAQFHLQNPFGVKWVKNYGQPKYFGWNNVPQEISGIMTCKDFVVMNDGVTHSYDHDVLFMYVMSSRDMMM
jgi:hypothetical protein